MRTTNDRQSTEPVFDRDRAWAHLTETGLRRHQNGLPPGRRTLHEIARGYDNIVRHAERLVDSGNADVLAGLKVIRMLREKLDHDELILITQARQRSITWQRIAEALEMRSRQSAERRHLQLQSVEQPDGTPARTQSERVDLIREKRGRRAEQGWVLSHGASIRAAAQRLAALEDLEQRLNRALESRVIDAVLDTQRFFSESTPAALRGAWPQALRACLADDARFRANPDVGSAPDVEWERRRRESQLLYRMFGLVAHAASPDSIDLSDHRELAEAIAQLCAQQQEAVIKRR